MPGVSHMVLCLQFVLGTDRETTEFSASAPGDGFTFCFTSTATSPHRTPDSMGIRIDGATVDGNATLEYGIQFTNDCSSFPVIVTGDRLGGLLEVVSTVALASNCVRCSFRRSQSCIALALCTGGCYQSVARHVSGGRRYPVCQPRQCLATCLSVPSAEIIQERKVKSAKVHHVSTNEQKVPLETQVEALY